MIYFVLNPFLVLCQRTLTISIYINPVKHSVSELLRRCFLIFISIDCADGLGEDEEN